MTSTAEFVLVVRQLLEELNRGHEALRDHHALETWKLKLDTSVEHLLEEIGGRIQMQGFTQLLGCTEDKSAQREFGEGGKKLLKLSLPICIQYSTDLAAVKHYLCQVVI